MVKFSSEHGTINVREIGKPRKEEFIDAGVSYGDRLRHTVKVTFNGETAQFGYSTCVSDYQAGKVMMSDEDLHFALSSFLEDGLYTEDGFENFCDELGYEMWGEDPDYADPDTGYDEKSYKVYKACERERAQAERIGITVDMTYDILEEIREAGYE